nr:hypothetical protein Iba_chr01bCG3680 [Ipomoea batatas]
MVEGRARRLAKWESSRGQSVWFAFREDFAERPIGAAETETSFMQNLYVYSFPEGESKPDYDVSRFLLAFGAGLIVYCSIRPNLRWFNDMTTRNVYLLNACVTESAVHNIVTTYYSEIWNGGNTNLETNANGEAVLCWILV